MNVTTLTDGGQDPITVARALHDFLAAAEESLDIALYDFKLDPGLEEMATVFAMPCQTRVKHVMLPQLAPYIAAATRAGLSLVWKIVLVVELMGRSNGVGFEIGSAFQLFDVALLLAYALPFVGIMLAIETFLVQPFERHVSRWRPKAA